MDNAFERLIVGDINFSQIKPNPIGDDGSVGAQTNRYDPGAVPSQIFGGCLAYPRGPTADQRDLAFK
ncbi:hypothetical protein D3C75_1332340 [compost metagenome]